MWASTLALSATSTEEAKSVIKKSGNVLEFCCSHSSYLELPSSGYLQECFYSQFSAPTQKLKTLFLQPQPTCSFLTTLTPHPNQRLRFGGRASILLTLRALQIYFLTSATGRTPIVFEIFLASTIGVGVNFRGHRIFSRKICIKKISKMPELYMILARKMPEFYIITAQKIFSRFFLSSSAHSTYTHTHKNNWQKQHYCNYNRKLQLNSCQSLRWDILPLNWTWLTPEQVL